MIINTIKIGRTKMSWNNHVYCQLDMLANIVNKGLNNFTQREYMEGKSQIFSQDFPYSSRPQNHPCWNHRLV